MQLEGEEAQGAQDRQVQCQEPGNGVDSHSAIAPCPQTGFLGFSSLPFRNFAGAVISAQGNLFLASSPIASGPN